MRVEKVRAAPGTEGRFGIEGLQRTDLRFKGVWSLSGPLCALLL